MDNSVRLWDAETGRGIRAFRHNPSIDEKTSKKYWGQGQFDETEGAFSPDGTRVITGSQDKTLKLWDVSSGAELRTLEGHTGPVSAVAFSPDGRQVISGSADTSMKVWNIDSGKLLASLLSRDGEWLAITPEGFFDASPRGENLLSVIRGVNVTAIGQVHQSLFNPDLVREALAFDPDGEVRRAAEVINLEKVIDSGPAPDVKINSPAHLGEFETDLATLGAHIRDLGSGIGRIEWRVNGITVAVRNAPSDAGSSLDVTQQVALDYGDNVIDVIAYNKRNLMASLPAETSLTFKGSANAAKKLHVLAIGIDNYVDEGWTPPGGTKRLRFPPLGLAVTDAKAVADGLKKAGAGLYSDVDVTTALDEEATAANIDAAVTKIAAETSPRDTFVFFVAGHGYSNDGRFYLIPQDYQGGINPEALAAHAIDQQKLQDWIANRIKAKKALILLDTCELGALTNGYEHSRVDGPASEAGVGRLHEATGRPVLTASAAKQYAHEGEIGGLHEAHGVFTWAVLDALRNGDANGDGVIELSELVAHVQTVVPGLAKGLARAVADTEPVFGVQTPRFASPAEDFVLVSRLQ